MDFVNLKSQYKSIKKEIETAIANILENAVYIGGAEVTALENEIANYCNTKYAVAVNSGTDALFLSLKALGIGNGDEVITTPFTFIATAEVIANIGAKPVFVDIDPHSFNIDPKKIEAKITKKTKAIIPVHLFGLMADMTPIMAVARAHKLHVLEDAAQSIGATYKGKKCGSFGITGCFSFFPAKNLGCYGDGGIITTNNKTLAEKLMMLRNHGSSSKEKYKNIIIGTNSRLDSLQAAILRVKLKCLDQWNQKRRENVLRYQKGLQKIPQLILPNIQYPISSISHVFNQYTIRTKRRDELKTYLDKQGIPAMIYYPLPLHLQPAFHYLGYKKGDFPESERATREVLSLPIYPELSLKEQRSIIQNIKKFYAEN